MRVIALNKHGVSSNFTACLDARKKTERFSPLIANVLFISINSLLEKLFVDFCVFVHSYMHLRSDRCVIKDIFA